MPNATQQNTHAPDRTVSARGAHRFKLALPVLSLLSLAGGLFCVWRVLDLILTVGANNISNDYVAFIQVVDRVLAGDVNWSLFIHDTFVGQHCVALPVLFHSFVARFFEWNARSELIVGGVFTFIRALLVTDLITFSFDRRLRPLAFGVVLALTFSVSQSSIHLWGQALFPVGLSVFGFVLGLWGLVRLKGTFAAIALMIAGGLIAALSMGNIPPLWFAFLVALIVVGYRKPRDYFFWLAGALVALSPYALYVFGQPRTGGGASAVGAYYLVNVLGRQFSNDIGINCGRLAMAEYAGVAGLLALIAVLFGCCLIKRWPLSARASLAMCAYGLSSGIMLSVVRQMVAPWYTGFLNMFWVGLLGLAITIFVRDDQIEDGERGETRVGGARRRALLAARVLTILLVANVCVLYVKANKTWTDKHAYLYSRAPASEAGLRHYRTAPTYIEGLLFLWGDGTPGCVEELAMPLERHRLSAFADHQRWALQGDFVLSRVKIKEHKSVPDIRWLQGWDVNRTFKWSHYEFANLYLHSPNYIDWTLTFPSDLRSAVFKTEARLAKNAPRGDGATLLIAVKEKGQTGFAAPIVVKPVTADRGAPVELALDAWRGKTITLRITSLGGRDPADDAVVLRYPVIDVVKNPSTVLPPRERVKPRPSNVDISESFPLKFAADRQLPPPDSWQRKNFSLNMPVTGAEKMKDFVKSFPSRAISFDTPLSINDFSHLKLRMSALKKVSTRSIKAILTTDSGAVAYFSMPAIQDEGEHDYLYDLKLLELNQTEKLSRLELYPVATDADDLVGCQVKNVSFVRIE